MVEFSLIPPDLRPGVTDQSSVICILKVFTSAKIMPIVVNPVTVGHNKVDLIELKICHVSQNLGLKIGLSTDTRVPFNEVLPGSKIQGRPVRALGDA